MTQSTWDLDRIGLNSKIFADRVRLLHKNLFVSIPSNFVCALVVFIGLLASTSIEPLVSWLWLSGVVLVSLFRLFAAYLYFRRPATNLFHLRLFIIGMVISASLWGIADSVLMPEDDLLLQMIIIVIVAGVTAGGIQTLNASVLASMIYVLLTVAPLSIWLFMQDGMTYMLLGVAMTTYLLFMLVTSVRGCSLLEKTLMLQYENLALVEDLTESNSKIMHSYKLLEQHESDLQHFNKLNDMLQICKNTNETHPIITFIAKEIFTHLSGALVLKNQATENYEVMSQWGKDQSINTLFTEGSCWALRKGRSYIVSHAEKHLVCDHFNSQPESYICLPITIQSKIAGSLVLYSHENAEISRYHQQLASSFVEIVQLNFSNILLRETLYEQSIRDPLTGLYNRRYLDETVHDRLRNIILEGKKFSIAMIDLDYFKNYNDAYGHDAGDTLLKAFSHILKKHFHLNDLAFRYGGEEFLIVLADSDIASARSQIDKIRDELKKNVMLNGKHLSESITISVGIAEAPLHGETTKEVIQAADKALYSAKQGGRDRIACFNYSEIV